MELNLDSALKNAILSALLQLVGRFERLESYHPLLLSWSEWVTAVGRQHSLRGCPYLPGHNSWKDKLIFRIRLKTLYETNCWAGTATLLKWWRSRFREGGMSQAAAPAAWVSLSHSTPCGNFSKATCLFISPFLFPSPSRHCSCGPQVSLCSLVNRLNLPLSCPYLPNSNHSLSTVKFKWDSNIWQLSLCIQSDTGPLT